MIRNGLQNPTTPLKVLPKGAPCRKAPIVGEGLRYQVAEVHRCVREDEPESPVIRHAETVQLAATMDRIRTQVGVRYPGE